MTGKSVEAIVRALNQAGVRYLIVGGLAVVAHGHVRFTADVDIVLDLERENASRAVAALAGLGYRPRAPVALVEFADPDRRREWIRQKGLTVFSLYSPAHPATEIDLFVEPPFDFARAHREAKTLEVHPGVEAVFVGLRDLIAMKEKAGRPIDLADATRLRELANEGNAS